MLSESKEMVEQKELEIVIFNRTESQSDDERVTGNGENDTLLSGAPAAVNTNVIVVSYGVLVRGSVNRMCA